MVLFVLALGVLKFKNTEVKELISLSYPQTPLSINLLNYLAPQEGLNYSIMSLSSPLKNIENTHHTFLNSKKFLFGPNSVEGKLLNTVLYSP